MSAYPFRLRLRRIEGDDINVRRLRRKVGSVLVGLIAISLFAGATSASAAPGWEGFVTNKASGCSARVQAPYLNSNQQVTAYTELFCPQPTQLTVRSRLRSDYQFADITVAQRGCSGGSGCVVSVPKGFSFYQLSCPKSGNRRNNQRYYSDIIFYPGTQVGKATSTRSRSKSLSPFCAY